jgi:pentatricopeptide repeat protein
MEYITDIRKRVEDALRASDGQHDEALEDLYRHTNRRLINLLIDKRDLDRAERILNEMIENEYDVEYAKGELKRVENLRNGKS